VRPQMHVTTRTRNEPLAASPQGRI
jgi:hypothetical protein